MGHTEAGPARGSGLARVRDHLLGSLYLARLAPGARVPSVRRMAQLTGLDRKTVHRAYMRLAGEGFLVARPGSGTYLAPEPVAPGGADPAGLLEAAERFRGDAAALGLDARTFARFLERMAEPRLAAVPLAVVECNREQLGLIAREVGAVLGADVRSVLLQELPLAARALASSVRAVVTTECHREEVQRQLDARVPVLRVALDPAHAELLLRHARHGTLVMVVRDARFAAAFGRLMLQLRVPADVQQRIAIVEPHELERLFRQLDPPVGLYVSPLLGADRRRPAPPGWRYIAPQRYTDGGSLELLRAQVALLEARRADGPREQRTGVEPAASCLATS